MMFMSLGHHIYHVIRTDHVGWPLTVHLTPFTYSSGIYPLILWDSTCPSWPDPGN